MEEYIKCFACGAKSMNLEGECHAYMLAAQEDDRRAVNSVNIHLASLYAFFEKGVDFSELPRVRHQFSQFYKGQDRLKWLLPPQSLGESLFSTSGTMKMQTHTLLWLKNGQK